MEEKKEQKKAKAPRALTKEEIQKIIEVRQNHKQQKENDPEYRAEWERKTSDFDRLAVPLMGDSIETE